MAEIPTLSVIVPTHDRHRSLSDLVTQLTLCPEVTEIIVVDDGSQPRVECSGDKVLLIRHEQARLVSAARNAGASRATGSVLVFLDDDCALDRHSFADLIAAFERTPSLGMAGPMICYKSDPGIVWCAGIVRSTLSGRARFRGRGLSRHAIRTLSPTCDEFPTAFALSRDCWEAVGGFDERGFPMHLEEADLAARVNASDFAVELVPGWIVLHDFPESGDLARRLHMVNASRAYLVARSTGRFIRRHAPSPWRRLLWIMVWVLGLAPVYLLALLMSHGRSIRERSALLGSFARGFVTGLAG